MTASTKDSVAADAFVARIKGMAESSLPSPQVLVAGTSSSRADRTARIQQIIDDFNRSQSIYPKSTTTRVNIGRHRYSLNTSSTSRKARSEMEARTGVRGVSWKQILQGIAGILAILFAGYWATHDTPENRATNERALFQVDIARLEAEKSKAWAAVELARVEKMPSQVAANSSGLVRPVLAIRSFDCLTLEQAKRGFAKHDVQVISNASTTYRASSGCAWIRITSHVENFSASGVYLFQEELDGDRYFECGSFPGRGGHSPEQCKQYLNNHLNQDIRLVIGSSGSININ